MDRLDRTDHRCKQRSRHGLGREQNLHRTNHLVEPTSGSRGVSIHKRIKVLQYATAYTVGAASRKFDVHPSSIYRWMRRIDPFQMTGNKERYILTGLDQFLLAMGIYLYPRASADELATFIFVNGGAPNAYSRQDVSKRLKELNITRKKCSLEAYQAFTPRNLLRARLFWERGPRIGVQGVRRFRLTDTDEAKFSLIKVESKRGWGYRAQRVRDCGYYSKNPASVNLIMTVEAGNPYLDRDVRGSTYNPRKWWRITVENTNQYNFGEYIDEVLSDIEAHPVPGGFDEEKYLMWDNLSSHSTAYVTAMVEHRPTANQYSFMPLRRPPYQPKFAPIEYVFGEISCILARKCARGWNIETLAEEVHNACVTVGMFGSLDRTFEHCGYAL